MTERPAIPKDWIIFGLAFSAVALAGLCLIQWGQLARKYEPKIVTKEVIKEVVTERPIVVPDEITKPINLKAADLVKHMMKHRGFLIKHQDDHFILMCEREVPKRAYVAIDVTPDGLIKYAETSILMKQANSEESAMNHYMLDCMAFQAFFGHSIEADRMKLLRHIASKITDGFRDYDVSTIDIAQLRFDRGPRDYQDAFILSAKSVPE